MPVKAVQAWDEKKKSLYPLPVDNVTQSLCWRAGVSALAKMSEYGI